MDLIEVVSFANLKQVCMNMKMLFSQKTFRLCRKIEVEETVCQPTNMHNCTKKEAANHTCFSTVTCQTVFHEKDIWTNFCCHQIYNSIKSHSQQQILQFLPNLSLFWVEFQVFGTLTPASFWIFDWLPGHLVLFASADCPPASTPYPVFWLVEIFFSANTPTDSAWGSHSGTVTVMPVTI